MILVLQSLLIDDISHIPTKKFPTKSRYDKT